MKVETKQITNGIDVTRLREMIDEIKNKPELAEFKVRVANRWVTGAETRSEVQGFYGGGQERQHSRPFTLACDEPEMLLGEDKAPAPGEYLLHALACCVTDSIVYHAAAQGIQIEAMESFVEGDLDLRGYLGLDPTVRNGFRQIRMKFRVKADVPDEQIPEIANLGPAFSPVFDSLTRGTPVTVTSERM
jgi:uncharacterized OsmC-like protein